MAAQRAAGEASCGRLKPQLRPSALRPVLPAAKAALEAVADDEEGCGGDFDQQSHGRFLHTDG